ncbi:MAG: zinc ribbon domain-containing protein [Oscillospiraceae bacterium]|nr:zinc ribbon domain-containing protein [Oscillospiraceae bacterium]
MPQVCPNCKTEVAEGKKFCHNCGSKVEAAPQPQFEIPPVLPPQPQFLESPPPPFQPPLQQPPPLQPQYAPAPRYNMQAEFEKPPKNSPYAPMGMLGYLGWLALMCIPVIGWIMAAVLSFAGNKTNRKNLARATLILIILGMALAAAGVILYLEFIKNLLELIKDNFEFKFGF